MSARLIFPTPARLMSHGSALEPRGAAILVTLPDGSQRTVHGLALTESNAPRIIEAASRPVRGSCRGLVR